MATNDFKPFAGGAGANVLSQADYEALAALTSGFGSGILLSENLNKVLRQGTVMAAALAQWIADNSGDDVLDDGTTTAIEESLTAALVALGLRAASTTQTGVVQLADAATILAGTDTAKAPTAASLLAGLLGAGGASGSDYVTIPYRDKTNGTRKNLIVQWGNANSDATGLVSFVFPVSFPNAYLTHLVSVGNATRVQYYVNRGTGSTSGANAYLSTTSGSAASGINAAYIAIGN